MIDYSVANANTIEYGREKPAKKTGETGEIGKWMCSQRKTSQVASERASEKWRRRFKCMLHRRCDLLAIDCARKLHTKTMYMKFIVIAIFGRWSLNLFSGSLILRWRRDSKCRGRLEINGSNDSTIKASNEHEMANRIHNEWNECGSDERKWDR